MKDTRQVVRLWEWKTKSILLRYVSPQIRVMARAPFVRPTAEFFSQWTWNEWHLHPRRRLMPAMKGGNR